MCATCGCGGDEGPVAGREDDGGHEHGHPAAGHVHEHAAGHEHERSAAPAVVSVEQQILARNDVQAQKNRRRLSEQRVLALNLMSSPGAGKTTLLERTVREIGADLPVQVIEGDQETDRDARRIREAGCPVVQLNTGTGCHLDAAMVDRGLHQLSLLPGSLLLIENVGNLVCPALFDLGEHARVVVSAVTDGDDKPVKYPHMFRAATIVVLNKMDLLPYVPFEPRRFIEHARQVNPRLRVFPLSATRGDGLPAWYGWVRELAHHGWA